MGWNDHYQKDTEETEQEIVDSIPFKENRTEKQFHAEVKKRFVSAGYDPTRAVYDNSGNCTLCGESGRCYGWHLV